MMQMLKTDVPGSPCRPDPTLCGRVSGRSLETNIGASGAAGDHPQEHPRAAGAPTWSRGCLPASHQPRWLGLRPESESDWCLVQDQDSQELDMCPFPSNHGNGSRGHGAESEEK